MMREALVRSFAKMLGVRHLVDGGMWIDETGPMAKALVIKYTVPGPVAELWLEQLDGKRQFGKLRLINNTATAGVMPGDYSLNSRGRTSAPTGPYTIEITAPPSAPRFGHD